MEISCPARGNWVRYRLLERVKNALLQLERGPTLHRVALPALSGRAPAYAAGLRRLRVFPIELQNDLLNLLLVFGRGGPTLIPIIALQFPARGDLCLKLLKNGWTFLLFLIEKNLLELD